MRAAVHRRQRTDSADRYDVSLAAVSKHIRVLEGAGLVRRFITGREHWLALEASRLEPASQWLDAYRRFWESGLDRLEARLREPTPQMSERIAGSGQRTTRAKTMPSWSGSRSPRANAQTRGPSRTTGRP